MRQVTFSQLNINSALYYDEVISDIFFIPGISDFPLPLTHTEML